MLACRAKNCFIFAFGQPEVRIFANFDFKREMKTCYTKISLNAKKILIKLLCSIKLSTAKSQNASEKWKFTIRVLKIQTRLKNDKIRPRWEVIRSYCGKFSFSLICNILCWYAIYFMICSSQISRNFSAWKFKFSISKYRTE